MDVQVLGYRGMLGQQVVAALERFGHRPVYSPAPKPIEWFYPSDIYAGTVINCAGKVLQREAGVSHADFIRSNSLGPNVVADACNRVGARLIHVSTDCVFSSPGPHNEESKPDPESFYGYSKLMGEIKYDPHLTVRTSFVGFGKWGLVQDIQTRKLLYASSRLLWSGHVVWTIANVLAILAERPDITGLLHIPGEFQNRYDLVMTLKAFLESPVRVIQDDSFVADRRLESIRWDSLTLGVLPTFAEELENL